MQQFVVPQFIDVEDKILGPLTVRQFIILLVLGCTGFLLYKLADFALFLAIGIPLFAFSFTLAFVRINGQPFHFYLLNVFQYSRRPKLRIWDKQLADHEVREFMSEAPPPPPQQRFRKEAPTATKLAEISLIVNTGGVYRPEEWETS